MAEPWDIKGQIIEDMQGQAQVASQPLNDLLCVRIEPTEEVGSCNGCQTRKDKQVFLIELKSTSFRLCYACAESLKKELSEYI